MPVQTGRLVLFRQHMADVQDVDVKLQFLAIFHYFLLALSSIPVLQSAVWKTI